MQWNGFDSPLAGCVASDESHNFSEILILFPENPRKQLPQPPPHGATMREKQGQAGPCLSSTGPCQPRLQFLMGCSPWWEAILVDPLGSWLSNGRGGTPKDPHMGLQDQRSAFSPKCWPTTSRKLSTDSAFSLFLSS